MKRSSYRQMARQSGKGIGKFLGELEAETMDMVWAETRPVTVRDVLTKLNARRDQPFAYTTVMTVMTHLTDKGLLARELVGQTYEYRVSQSRDAFLRRASKEVAEEMVADFGDAAIAGLLETIGRVDPERLRDLQRYITQGPLDP